MQASLRKVLLACSTAKRPMAAIAQEITVFLNGLKRAECTVKAFDGGTPDEACGFSTAPLSLFLAGGCKAGGWAV